MSDVLFDFNQATLKPGAKEKLARVSGILLAYPTLHLSVEGHTLFLNRAAAVFAGFSLPETFFAVGFHFLGLSS